MKTLFVELWKNKLWMPGLMLAVIVIDVVLILLLSAIWPVYFAVGLFLRHKQFYMLQDWYFKVMPKINITPPTNGKAGS